ncbi:hypothetical protein I7I48_05102 [Histoplasma ohiense]|nr:hypothetical protein I7I48_05102 [Histoplasma ohiense (nom. inval.)]
MIPRGELVSLPCCSFSVFKDVILTSSFLLLKRREKLEGSLFFIITNERPGQGCCQQYREGSRKVVAGQKATENLNTLTIRKEYKEGKKDETERRNA